MTADEMKTLVDDLYLLSATDIDQAMQLYIHDDFVIEEAPELPMAGSYRGRQGLKALYADVFSMVPVTGLQRDYMMTGDHCCACRVIFEVDDPNQEPIELMEFFRFRDGKVIEIRPYYFSPGQFVRAAKGAKL